MIANKKNLTALVNLKRHYPTIFDFIGGKEIYILTCKN